jgi:hypothetical protein
MNVKYRMSSTTGAPVFESTKLMVRSALVPP